MPHSVDGVKKMAKGMQDLLNVGHEWRDVYIENIRVVSLVASLKTEGS